ncbi:MAG TPA: hypothetical protein VH540_26505 [Ktedonobacterales bacterium]
MSPEANTYLNEVLDSLQAHSVRREKLDWPALRRQVINLAAEAQTPAETYPAIRRALELLGDKHSFFLAPEEARQFHAWQGEWVGFNLAFPEGRVAVVYPGSLADQGGVHVGDHMETMNYTSRRAAPAGRPTPEKCYGQPVIRVNAGQSHNPETYHEGLTIQAALCFDRAISEAINKVTTKVIIPMTSATMNVFVSKP